MQLHHHHHPERPHHSLPVQGSLCRYTVRYLEPLGSVQHLSITSTWEPSPGEGRTALWRHLARALELGGCKILEAVQLADQVVELEVPDEEGGALAVVGGA